MPAAASDSPDGIKHFGDDEDLQVSDPMDYDDGGIDQDDIALFMTEIQQKEPVLSHAHESDKAIEKGKRKIPEQL